MKKSETATFGTGCFWCTEAIFQRLKGVENVTSGYSGGETTNPSYREVCSGTTGHAECLRIYYDPDIISYEDLLEVFWASHDPTTLNRQGNDIGTQYRSVIFYHDEDQKERAVSSKEKMDASGAFKDSIVTSIVPATDFYPAEPEHMEYYNRNPLQPYCYYVTRPKVERVVKMFPQKIAGNDD